MKKKVVIALMAFVISGCSTVSQSYQTEMDPATAANVDHIIQTQVLPHQSQPRNQIMAEVSQQFLGTPYVANTLKGGNQQPEILVANFHGVDCFTYLDYVAALSESRDRQDFLKKLVAVRYKNSQVDYLHRKHFFTDWYASAPVNADAITTQITSHYQTVQKQLNRKADGGVFISGLEVQPRTLHYILPEAVTAPVLAKLRNGDLIGIYSKIDGLDVSHVGIAIIKNGQVWYRNASSLKKNMKVTDVLLTDYIKNKPGIVVLRIR